MFQKSISLSGKSDSLIIDWGHDWSNLSIRQKGRLVGSFETKEELELGHRFRLDNGQEILVILRDTGLEVWHQGKDLVSGTASGQVALFDRSINVLILVGLIQLGAVPPLIFAVEGVGLGLSIAGGVAAMAVVVGLSFWAKRTGDKTPFWVGIGFCVLDLGLLRFSIPNDLWQISVSIVGTCIALAKLLYQGILSAPPAITQRRDWGRDAPLDSDM